MRAQIEERLNGSWIGHARRGISGLDFRSRGRYPYAATIAAVLVASIAMRPVRDGAGVLNVTLIYLLLVFIVALVSGSGPASLAAVLSFLLLDFFFIPPYHTFSVARSDHVLALFVYLGVAIVTGQLVARAQQRTDVAEREQARTALLYELNAALIADVSLDAILHRIVERVVTVYGAVTSQLLLPDEQGQLAVRASYPADQSPLDRQQRSVAAWVLENGSPAGQSTAGRRIRGPRGLTAAATPLMRREDDIPLPPGVRRRA